MRPKRLSVALTDGQSTTPVPIDWRDEEGCSVAISGITGTVDFDVEQTFDDILADGAATANWFVKTQNVSAATVVTLDVHATGVRLTMNAGNTGTFDATIVSN